MYIARGLKPSLAKQVAEQLMVHDSLAAHARDELGISETLRARRRCASGDRCITRHVLGCDGNVTDRRCRMVVWISGMSRANRCRSERRLNPRMSFRPSACRVPLPAVRSRAHQETLQISLTVCVYDDQIRNDRPGSFEDHPLW
jgi:hypothetical protein